MQNTEITNKLIVRKSPAGPQLQNLLQTKKNVRDDEETKVEDDEIDIPRSREKEPPSMQIDGKLACISQIISPREALCLSFTENFELLGGGYNDGTIRMYRTDNFEATQKLQDTEVNRTSVTSFWHRPVSKNYPVSNTFTCTYANGCVKCWNYNFNQCLYTIREKRQTYGLTYHPRLPKFVTYGDDENIYMYDEETRTQERILRRSDNPASHDGHTSRVYAGCFNPRSNHELCTGGWDNVVQFWDLRQPHAIRHLSGVHMCGEGIDINQKGTELITCAFQKEHAMQLWDYPSGKLIQNLEPDIYNSKLYAGRYIGKDFFVCGGTDPNMLRIIDTQNYLSKATVTNLPTGVYALDLGPDVRIKRLATERIGKNDLVGVPRIAVAAGKGVYQFEPV